MILVQFQELLYRQISLNFQWLSTAVLFDFTAVKTQKHHSTKHPVGNAEKRNRQFKAHNSKAGMILSETDRASTKTEEIIKPGKYKHPM